MKNHLSIIFLPTNKCNVNCEYCFEDKTDDRLTINQLEHIANKIFDFLDESHINSLTLHWQGGEIMTMPPHWFEEANEMIGSLAAARGKFVDHGLQTNMIGYSARWNDVIRNMFRNSVGTSMDYPNLYRKLFHAGPEEYTRIWRKNVRAARNEGIKVGVIAVPNQATLAIGAERFYSFFVNELGILDFQVNTPFPGGEQNGTKRELALENEELSRFFTELADIWVERGRDTGVKLGPIDQLIEYFMGEPSCLPCIWQTNCADEFISIDARGFVAQCDCWVTGYPEYFFGNIFEEPLGTLLKNSSARKQFLQRPAAILDQGCLECDYLSLCHGGCPVRTYTFRHTLFEKDPYCQLYKSLFRHTEELARKLAGDQFFPQGVHKPTVVRNYGGSPALENDLSWQAGPLVQIERRRSL